MIFFATTFGNSVSTMVTRNVQLAVPQLFEATIVTVVTPVLNVCPDPVPLPDPFVAPLNVYVSAGAGEPVAVTL